MRVPQALLNFGGFTVERVTSWCVCLRVYGAVTVSG
jgi:hypothetical protein